MPVPGLVEPLNRFPVRYRAMLLLATFASLGFGELAALRRCDIDVERCCVRMARSLVQMNDGKLTEDEPKSRAGPPGGRCPPRDRAGNALASGAVRGPGG